MVEKSRLIYASSLSAITNAFFVTGVTILAELNEPLKEWLKALTGHHWTSKSILSLALYLIFLVFFYAISRDTGPKDVRGVISLAIWSAIAGSILILAFFTGHHLELY